MTTRTQRVMRPDGATTHTVIGTDFMPIEPVAQYLDFMRLDGASENTIRAYSRGLALWFDYLDRRGLDWTTFTGLDFGHWTAWLRTGDLPDDLRIGPPPTLLAPATIQLRAAAVLAFYRYHAAANALTLPYDVLYSPLAKRGRRPYSPFLEGIADRGGSTKAVPMFKVRSGPKGRTPVMTPEHVQAILDTCATQRADGSWTDSLSSLRNRFYFALLAETGMRPGEALALRHSDIHLGQGDQPRITVTPRQDHPHGARIKSGQYRTIYVGDDLEALYAEYVWRLVDAGADMTVKDFPTSFVFVNSDTSRGEPFRPLRMETIYAAVRAIKRLHEGSFVNSWTPHWFRHTHATALLLSGCPPHVVMRRLGHLDVQTTLSVYGWVTEDAELRAVADWRTFAQGWKDRLS